MPEQDAYAEFARRLYQTNIISDPWIFGNERFRLDPIVLTKPVHDAFVRATEAIGALFDELADLVWRSPDLLDSYFSLSPYQKGMWLSSGGRWHGIARLDLFILEDGSIRCCEMNSDTPSGEAEAVLVNQIIHEDHPGVINPNLGFGDRFVSMAFMSWEGLSSDNRGTVPNVGILYPTDLPEDLSMIAIYREWFEARGCAVTLGSPYNVHVLQDGRALLFDRPIDLLIRHYKTDWWGEREPVWLDAPDYNDPDPLDPYLEYVLNADVGGRLAIVNPFGSVLTQNKVALAFMWEEMERFTDASQATIRAYFPEARRLRTTSADEFPREEWVLKSDYGCEGEEVVIGPLVDDALWQLSLEQATPGRWIAQRFFKAADVGDGWIPNYGAYLIAGRFSGYFTRLSRRSTDYTSVAAATFVES